MDAALAGHPGGADAQYGNMEVAGHGYAPCVTSPQEFTACGWNRAHEVVSGREIAASLFPDRWGLWLNPHAPGGGIGIPGSTCAASASASTGLRPDHCGSASPRSRSPSTTPC